MRARLGAATGPEGPPGELTAQAALVHSSAVAVLRELAEDEVVSMFLHRVRKLRSCVARLYLFGSHARGDWRPDSDYDFLVVMPQKDRVIIDRLYQDVQDILLETGSLVSLKILSVEQFDRLRTMRTPFMVNVMAEGVELGLDDQGTHQGLPAEG